MKKIFLFILMLIIMPLSVNASNNIYNIDINVNLQKDGSAVIDEVWVVRGSDGTEWYKVLNNLGNSEISNFKVLMDYKELTYKDNWDINASLKEKALYYGINNTSQGIELCFGKYDYKKHTFILHYTLSNMVFNTSDSQVLYFKFIDKLSNVNFIKYNLTISSYYEFPNDLDVLGYGYKGYAYVENGKIKMSNVVDDDMNNKYVVSLVKFPLGTFNTNNKYSKYNSFQDVYNEARKGSFNYDYDKDESVSIIITLIISFFSVFIIIAAIINGIHSGYGYINNKKIDKKKTPMFRDIPCNKDIYYANALISLNTGLFKYKESNILGAILLKWVREDKIIFKKKDDKDTNIIDLTKNPTFEYDLEKLLFDIMYEASGDGILETKEFEKWCRRHYEKFLNVFNNITNDGVSKLKNEGHVYKRTNKAECKKKDVMDDKIYVDSTRLYGLKLYLTEFSRMDTKEVMEVKLWDEYLMFAYLFGIADKVAKQFKNLYPEVIEQMENANIDYNTLIFVNNISNSSVRAASGARAAENYSSGGGGGGSFGGGGGGSR